MTATERLKSTAKAFLARPAIWKLSAPLRRAGCFVLTYHRIGDGEQRFPNIPAPVFAAQMQWLKDHCEVIDPSAMRARVDRADPARPPVLVTFDDGYKDFHDNAYPILRRLRIPVVVFLPTRFIDEGVPFWWDLIDAALHHTTVRDAPDPDHPGRTVALSDRSARRAYGRLWKAQLKAVGHPDRTPLLDRALDALGFTRASVPVDRQVMTWDEVRSTMDVVTYGGHTHNHPIMPRLDEPQLIEEVALCTDRIAAETGRRPQYFAYPSGACNDLTRRIVGEAGYDLAFTTVEGINTRGADALALRRYHAPARPDDLSTMLSGWGHQA